MGAKPPKTVTTVQGPWQGQEPYLKDIFEEAKKQYQGEGPKYFPESTLAPESAETLAGRQAYLDYARGGATDLSRAATGAVGDILSGRYLTAESNPYLASYTNAAIRPMTEQFTESILPNIRGNAMSTGGFGGSRQGIAEGLASGRFSRAIGDITSDIYNNAYNTGMQQFSRAIDQTPTALTVGGLPAMMTQQVGGQVDARRQLEKTAEIDRWNYEQNLQREKLAQYLRMVSGNLGGATTAPVGTIGNPLTGALGGAMSGAALASMLGGTGGAAGGAAAGATAGSAVPGYGTLIGAGIGGLVGLLGSR